MNKVLLKTVGETCVLNHRRETIYRVLACKLRGDPEVDSIHIVVIGQQR